MKFLLAALNAKYIHSNPALYKMCIRDRKREGDGTQGIINREDEMIFSDAEMIEDLQMVTCLGRAIVDGRAVLFELLPFEEDEEIKIIASLILL